MAKDLYYNVHEDDGGHAWMAIKQLEVSMAVAAWLSCGVFYSSRVMSENSGEIEERAKKLILKERKD